MLERRFEATGYGAEGAGICTLSPLCELGCPRSDQVRAQYMKLTCEVVARPSVCCRCYGMILLLLAWQQHLGL